MEKLDIEENGDEDENRYLHDSGDEKPGMLLYKNFQLECLK